MTYPPRPSNISIPAVIAGNVLQNDDTSISAIDSGYDGAVVIKTENKLAMLINPEQKVSISTDNTESMLTINNDNSMTSTIRLSYQDSFYFDGRVTANGNVLFIPSCDNLNLDPYLTTAFKKNVDILDHDGSSKGLYLGSSLVTATATELNYVDVPIGTARPNKAMVLDSSLSISGINQLTAVTLGGTLTTRDQPNITTLNNINITGDFRIKGDIFNFDLGMLNYIKVPNEGAAYASKAVILDSNKNFVGVNNLSANRITGILTNGPQPNITSLSALTSLINNGPSTLNGITTIKTAASEQLVLKYSETIYSSVGTNANGDMVLRSVSNKISTAINSDFQIVGHNGASRGLVLGDSLVVATGTQLNYTTVTPGTASANRCVVLDGSKNVLGINQLGANLLAGTLQTGAQPAITSVTTLHITGHNGSTSGLTLGGTLVTSTAAKLNYVDTTPGEAQANRAVVADSLKNISGIASLSATTLSGLLTTEDQPNIKKVNTLTVAFHNGTTTGLRLGSTLVTATGTQLNRLDVDSGVSLPGKALVTDGSNNIAGINNIGAATVTGIIQTTNQPNINQVNTLNVVAHDGITSGLSLNGILVTSTALQLNRVNIQSGTTAPNKAMILDSALSISGVNILNANTLGGVLSNPTQPNVRNLTSLNVVDHDGGTTGLSLNGTLVKSTANQLNYVSVQQGIAAASKALVLDSSKSISNINVITAVDINGVIRTPAQPYITRVGTLNVMDHNGSTNGLSLNGVLILATAEQMNRMTAEPGVASTNKALIINESKNISGINVLNATTLTGTLSTSNQPNITTVSVLNVNSHNGTIGLSLGGTIVTANATQINRLATSAGSAAPDKALIVDSLRNISNINSLSATNLTGTILTNSQPNITSVATLNLTNHDGGSNGLKLNGTLVVATASQLNSTSVVPGSATSLRALVTSEFNSISGINTLSATKLTADQLSLTGVISNFNTGGVIIKSYSFTDIIGRMIDIDLLTALSFSRLAPGGMPNGYSCEIIGYISPRFSEIHTFYITCNDRVRLWVNGDLLLHSWAPSTSARISSTIFLNADQWVPIYIQYQVDTNSVPFFLLESASASNPRSQIGSARLAWDNNMPAVSSKHSSQNSLTIYNTATAAANTAKFSVDTSGDLTIDASGNDITLGSSDNLNIPAHDGSTKGLYLGGVLVKPTAYELNYLKVSPGAVSPSQALVVDASKSLNGINSLSATSIACDSLSTSAFTISNLSLSGPLNNFNTGALLIRQITGPDVSGRVVDVDTITNIDLNNRDPKELNSNFSMDIIGYILPTFTETYRFHAIANDRVRIWVANTLIMNVWDTSSGLEYTSDSILLTAGQWVPIYIQFQNITGTSSLQVRWSSSSLVKSFINNSYMAWDNSFVRPPRATSSSDKVTIFSSSAGLTSVQTGTIAVDGIGNMSLSATSNLIKMASNVNITTHNGTNGLYLAGSLVAASAAELNYLAGATPGAVGSFKALILDANKSLTGFNTISSTDLNGTIRTGAQPYITSFGTLSSTLNSSSDIVLSNSLRLGSDSTASYVQAASDLFIGNYGSTMAASARKIMIKANGFVGIQTASPSRALSVNGSGSTYCMRLINNSNNGSETAFCDIGVDSSSNLLLGSNVIIGSTGTATIAVNSSGVMKITSGSLQVGNTSNSTLPLEVGSASFTINTASGYLNSEGSTGVVVPAATSYSIRTTSSIIVNGTVCITSDRRLKEDIETLSYDSCRRFIMSTRPVKFKYTNDPLQFRHCGLIAQDIAKTEFSTLVNMAPYQGIEEDVDFDGYVSPANAALNVSYEEIIPILMTTMKEAINDNALLKTHIYNLNAQLKSVKSRMKEMERLLRKLNGTM